MVIEAVVSQTLVPKIGGGRVLACEVMVANTAVRSLIRDDKVHQLQGMIEIGQKHGMQTMNQDLSRLFHKGLISMKDALGRSNDPESLQKLLQ
jgi:twitching motility protein PilT